MPSSAFAPRFLLALSFDPRPWAGVTVATHIGNITIPADAGLFLDIITALNGRGCYSLAQSLALNATGAGVWTCGIDADDRFFIECDGDDFTVGACAGLGLSAAGLVGGGGPVYRRTAQADWVRGDLRGIDLTITPSASAVFLLVGAALATLVESAPLYCAAHGADPYDATDGTPSTYNFSMLHRIGAGSASCHWSLDSDGHVQIAWSSSVGGAFAWSSASFRAALGFDGTETTDTSSGVVRLRANHPCPYAWAPTYPARRLTHDRGREGSMTRLRSTEVTATQRGTWGKLRVETWAHGPASTRDEVSHVTRRIGALLYPGARVTFYPERDETRFATTTLESSGGDYTAFATPQLDGRRGRRRYFVSDVPAALEWEDSLEYMALVALGLDEDES